MSKSHQTYNKIEKEKKRAKKREEKRKKKEMRKEESKDKPKGIDFAYVDHNGNLTDTPPDPDKREEVELEDIQISVPKSEFTEEDKFDPVREGQVTYFDPSKGYGFIVDSVNHEKYFTHISGHLDEISENDKVSYELEKGQKGMNAVRVKKI